MAATILAQIDTDGIRALLLSKMVPLIEKRVGGDDGAIGPAAHAIFREQLEAAEDSGVSAELLFAAGVEFGVESVLAVLTDPFGDPKAVLRQATDDVRGTFKYLAEDARRDQKAARSVAR